MDLFWNVLFLFTYMYKVVFTFLWRYVYAKQNRICIEELGVYMRKYRMVFVDLRLPTETELRSMLHQCQVEDKAMTRGCTDNFFKSN
jgi:hypothetical protein